MSLECVGQVTRNVHTCSVPGCAPLPLALGVVIPSLANGEVTDPSGGVLLLAAAAVAFDLVILSGVVSCSLPKGVAGALAGEILLSLAGSASMSWYQASRA